VPWLVPLPLVPLLVLPLPVSLLLASAKRRTGLAAEVALAFWAVLLLPQLTVPGWGWWRRR
jgi:hypothetical protein